MIPLSTLPIFAAAAIALIVAPGPDTLYIIARSVGQGRLAGIVSALGMFCGLMVHLTAATLGLSALIASSVFLFGLVKWAGALYLVYLGVRILVSRQQSGQSSDMPRADLRFVFRQAMLTNILNPKVGLFFIAFLPQFVSTKLGHVPLQIATLGLIFAVSGTLWNINTALMAGAVGGYLRKKPALAALQQRITGVVFVGLGVRMALMSKG
jgi:threonine/homoserine/homoserine lactone efflux protein